MRIHKRIRQSMLIVVLCTLAAFTLFPFFMTVIMSQKTNAEVYRDFWAMPNGFHFAFFAKAIRYIHHYVMNSVINGVLTVIGTVFLSSLAGYVFARLNFGGKGILFVVLMSLMMVPGILTLIPAFLWYKGFPFIGGNNWLGQGGHGFLNTRTALILPFLAGNQILGVYLCRTFFEQIPSSLFEAARIDGAGEFDAYFRIALPLSLPILATLAIITFVAQYNDYIWPLVTISDDTLQVFAVGIAKFSFEGSPDLAPIMAAYLIGSLPLIVVFAFGMRYYIEGLTRGGLKA